MAKNKRCACPEHGTVSSATYYPAGANRCEFSRNPGASGANLVLAHTAKRGTCTPEVPVCKAWHERRRDSWGSPNPAPFGAAFFVWGSLSMGSAIHAHIYNTYAIIYKISAPNFFKNCPKLLGGHHTPAPTKFRRNLPCFADCPRCA